MRNLPDFSISGVRNSQEIKGGDIVLGLGYGWADQGTAMHRQLYFPSTSSAILSSTRTYPKSEDSSGKLRRPAPKSGVCMKNLRHRLSDALIRSRYR